MIPEFSFFGLGYNFSSCCHYVFSTDFPIPTPQKASNIIQLPLDDLSPPFVDRPGYYLSVCPIRYLPKPLVSWSSQSNIVQEFSPHNCNQEIWWNVLNVVAATIPSVISGLTLFPKLFFYSMTSSCNVPLIWPYCLSM